MQSRYSKYISCELAVAKVREARLVDCADPESVVIGILREMPGLAVDLRELELDKKE